MKVFFDIITNHTADVIDYAGAATYTYIDKAAEPYTRRRRHAVRRPRLRRDRDVPGARPGDVVPLHAGLPHRATTRRSRCRPGSTTRRYYHNRGDSTFAGESSTYGDFFGLDDLFTEQPEVVDGMADIYKAWVDFGIDGFRIDTVKHVNMEFWQKFAPAIARTRPSASATTTSSRSARSSTPTRRSCREYTTEGRLAGDARLRLPERRHRASPRASATTGLRDFFADDDYYTDTDSNAYQLPTFLGNHDMGRDRRCSSRQRRDAATSCCARDQLAHSLMYLTRGQPVVYYGDEQGFIGDGGDKDARQDMFASQVASYNDDDLIGTDATTADGPTSTPSHPLYRTSRELSALRAEHPALADGAQMHRYASRQRRHLRVQPHRRRATSVEYVVAANNATTAKTVDVRRPFSAARHVPRSVAGRRPARPQRRRGSRHRHRAAAVGRRCGGPRRHARQRQDARRRSTSARRPPGGIVGGRAEIGVAVPDERLRPGHLRLAPGRHRRRGPPLGTDDNAPYRVFHDVTGLAKGTLLEYRAVAHATRSGNLSVASTYATVGDPPPPAGGGGGGGVGPVTQPDSGVACPGRHNTEMGCPGDWQPDVRPGPADARPQRPDLEGHVHAARRRATPTRPRSTALGRELRRRRRRRAAPTSRSPHRRRTGDVLLRPRARTGSPPTRRARSSPRPAASSASSAARPTGRPTACARGCRTPTATAPTPGRRRRSPPAPTSSRWPTACRWDENYGAGGAPDGANIALRRPGRRQSRDLQLRRSRPTC